VVHFREQAPAALCDRRETRRCSRQVNKIRSGTLESAVRDPRTFGAGLPYRQGLGTIGRVRGKRRHRYRGRLSEQDRAQRPAGRFCTFPKAAGLVSITFRKVHDSHNMMFALQIWGRRATDLNQGVVLRQTVNDGDEYYTKAAWQSLRLRTRFSVTVLKRFCIQGAVRTSRLTV